MTRRVACHPAGDRVGLKPSLYSVSQGAGSPCGCPFSRASARPLRCGPALFSQNLTHVAAGMLTGLWVVSMSWQSCSLFLTLFPQSCGTDR